MKFTGKQLKELREKHDITRQQLAEAVGWDRATIRKYEIYHEDPEKGLPFPEHKETVVKNAIMLIAMGGEMKPGAILDFYMDELKDQIKALTERIAVLENR